MTSSQYNSAMPRGVVAQLVTAARASLAASVSEYLKLGRRVSDHRREMKAAAFVSYSASSSPQGSIMTNSQIAEEAIRIIRGEEKGFTNVQANRGSEAPLLS